MADTDLYKSALSRTMALCSAREYCISDIRSKLDSWGIVRADAERIINNLLREKFIDELRYANAFARDKFRYNKWGKIKISSNLTMKGIPREITRQALDSIDQGDYRKVLENIISSHRKKIRAKNQYDLKAKLMRFGLSKGFESGLLYEILGEA